MAELQSTHSLARSDHVVHSNYPIQQRALDRLRNSASLDIECPDAASMPILKLPLLTVDFICTDAPGADGVAVLPQNRLKPFMLRQETAEQFQNDECPGNAVFSHGGILTWSGGKKLSNFFSKS